MERALARLDLTLRNELAEIARVQDAFRVFAHAQGLAAGCRRAVHLVLDELLTNIVCYAFDDDGPHLISVHVALDASELQIEVIDDGQPFDPFARPPPDPSTPLEERELGGLGIELVRRMMDTSSYGRRDGQNRVRLTKRDPCGAPRATEGA